MAIGTIGSWVLFLIFIIASGVLPAVFWLWFWLKEDTRKPEPTWLIARAFLLGALAVIPTYFLEKAVVHQGFGLTGPAVFSTVFIWATIEEVIKYLAVYVGALKSRYFDEPIDAMIYMISGALGFAALENILFMFTTQKGLGDFSFLLTGNFRFIGATVVHIVASAIIGCFIGLAFYAKPARRIMATLSGLVIAIALHALFNYSIISQGEGEVMTSFIVLWLLAILVIYLFEKVKKTIIKIKTRRAIK